MKEKDTAAFLSVIAAIALTTMKLIVGLLTGSLGVLSEALHSALDSLAAGMTWFAVKFSDKPADAEHPFGHGKMENLSALIESALLIGTCFWVVYEATLRLYQGTEMFSLNVWAFVVIIVSIVVDFFRARHLHKMAKKYNSQALEADALHFSTDILSSFVVLLGLVGSAFGYYFADCVAALGVSVIVLWVSGRLAYKAVNALIDTAPEGMIDKIESIVKSVEGVEQCHDVRVRSSGAEYEIDVNIHVKSTLTIVQAHDISENVENAIRTELGSCGVITIHTEPDC